MKIEVMDLRVMISRREAIEILAEIRKGSKEKMYDNSHGLGRLHNLLQANFESCVTGVHVPSMQEQT